MSLVALYVSCSRLSSSKVLTVQVVRSDLLQFVHLRCCRSPSLTRQACWWCWTLAGWQRVLLVCFQLLPVCAVQIHAKLSVSQPCTPKKEICFFVSCCSQLWWTLERLKKSPSPQAQESSCCFFSPPVAVILDYKDIFAWSFSCHCCLSRCFRVDDFAISTLDRMKEIAQYPSAIRQMLWAATHLSGCGN